MFGFSQGMQVNNLIKMIKNDDDDELKSILHF